MARHNAGLTSAVAACLVTLVATAIVLALYRPWRRRTGRHDVYVSFASVLGGPRPGAARATIRARRVEPSLPGTLTHDADDGAASRFTVIMQRALLGAAATVYVVPEQVVLEDGRGRAARMCFDRMRVEGRATDGTWQWVADVSPETDTRWAFPLARLARPASADAQRFMHIDLALDPDALRAGDDPASTLLACGGRLWRDGTRELRPNRHLSVMPIRQPSWAPAEAPACGRGIPPRIFQTFRRIDGKVPTRMRQVMAGWAAREPELEHYFYDDEACRAMIAQYFDERILRAYDALVPTAYKADLWRACALLLYGGYYFDVKISVARGVRLLREVDPGVSVLLATDRPAMARLGRRRDAMWNAVMGFPRGHALLRAYIGAIVSNVERRFYGETTLDITGPRLLGRLASEWYGLGRDLRYAGPARRLRGLDGKCDTLMLWHMETPLAGSGIRVWCGSDRERMVLNGEYSGYRVDQREFEACAHYSDMWRARAVYGEPGVV